MIDVHCFGVSDGQYKIHGKQVSIVKNGHWTVYPISTALDLCPVCDMPIRVSWIQGTSFLATCSDKHTQIFLRRNKESLCVRCGKEIPETDHHFWHCDECPKTINNAQWYQFNLHKHEKHMYGGYEGHVIGQMKK